MRIGIILLGVLFSVFSYGKYESLETFKIDKTENKVLVFLSEICPCSQSHIDHLKELVGRYPKISFYGVVAEPAKNKKDKLRKDQYFLSDRFPFPVIEDSKQELVKKYKALKTPHVSLLGKGGVLYEGGLTNKRVFKESSKQYLAENLQALSAGGKIKYRKGTSLGCYIRRVK